MWIKTLQVSLITRSLHRKRAKNIYIIKEHFHWQSRVQALSKTPIKITEAVYTMKLISYRFVHTWENSPERGIQSARKHFSYNSSEHLWLVIAFMSSTASCVIGYNAQCCQNVSASVSGSVPASKLRFEFSSWWYDALNDLIMLVWLF